jgi:hypothetical protein
MKRTPRNYRGIEPTGKNIGDLLPKVLRKMGEAYQERPDLVLAAWSEIIGEKLAPMAKAVSFQEGVLLVKVANSTLYSLLSQHERTKLLQQLRNQFPKVTIRNIIFRIG